MLLTRSALIAFRLAGAPAFGDRTALSLRLPAPIEHASTVGTLDLRVQGLNGESQRVLTIEGSKRHSQVAEIGLGMLIRSELWR